FLLEVLILWLPYGIGRRLQDPPKLLARFRLTALIEHELGQEKMGGSAVRIVGERSPQVLFRQLLVASQPARHLEIPSAQRAIGRTLQKRRIETKNRLELLFDGFAVFESRATSERFGQRSHVGSHPEVPFRPVRLRRHCRPPRLDTRFQHHYPVALCS